MAEQFYIEQNARASIPLLVLAGLVSPLLSVLMTTIVFWSAPSRKQAVLTASVIGFSMALASYGITYYDQEVDAVRLMYECSQTSGQSLRSVLASPPSGSSSLIVLNFWEWLIGRTGDCRLFQSSAAFAGYSLITWMVFDCVASHSEKRNILVAAYAFTLFAVPTQAIIGNVRSALVCIIAAAAFYYGATRRRCSVFTIAAMIIACGIHVMGIVPAVLWLMSPVIIRKPWVVGLCFFAAILLVSTFSQAIVSSLPLPAFFDEIVGRLLLYQEGTTFDQINAERPITKIVHLLDVVLLILILLRIKIAGCNGPLAKYAIVSSFCVFAMGLCLTNVGMRLMYLPLLLSVCSALCEAHLKRLGHGDSEMGLHFLDISLVFIVLALSSYSWLLFLKTFDVGKAVVSAFFFPGVFLS